MQQQPLCCSRSKALLQCRCQATIKSEDEKFYFETNTKEPVDCIIVCHEEEVQLDSTRESLSNTLCELDFSPSKVHSVVPHSKTSLGKRKLKQVGSTFTKKLVSVLKWNWLWYWCKNKYWGRNTDESKWFGLTCPAHEKKAESWF